MKFKYEQINLNKEEIGYISENAEIGVGGNHSNVEIEFPTYIGNGVRIDVGYIGAYTAINENTIIRSTERIGRYCSIAPGCRIGLLEHPLDTISSSDYFYSKKWGNKYINEGTIEKNIRFASSKKEIKKTEIKIGNDVWIGQNVLVKRGITIGDGAIIAAGAVVTKNVEPYEIVGGVPAKRIRYRFQSNLIKRIMDLQWWNFSPEYIGDNYPYDINDKFLDYLEEIKSNYKIFTPHIYLFSDSQKKVFDISNIKTVENLPLKGGISNKSTIVYDEKKKTIFFYGWLVPENKYNRIEVFADDEYIGQCKIGIQRTDVYNNFLEYNSPNAGFEAECFCANLPQKILLKVYKDEKIVYTLGGGIYTFKEYIDSNVMTEGMLDYEKIEIAANSIRKDITDIIEVACAGKQLVCCYGNCQILSINSLLLTSEKFNQGHLLLKVAPVHTLKAKEKKYGLNEDILSKVDLFIYQYIKKDNRFGDKLMTDYILDILTKRNKKCKVICIPNCYFTGYFPQYIPNVYNSMNTTIPSGDPFPYGDKNIQNMWKTMSASEIAEVIKKEDFYSEKYVQENANASLSELKEREKKCNVIISDYIENNYKNSYLFYTPNHVANEVLMELIIRTFEKVDIDCHDIKLEKAWENSGRQMFIYPSVKKGLGLSFCKDKFIYNHVLEKKPSNIEQYVEAYIHYCKPEWEKESKIENESKR